MGMVVAVAAEIDVSVVVLLVSEMVVVVVVVVVVVLIDSAVAVVVWQPVFYLSFLSVIHILLHR